MSDTCLISQSPKALSGEGPKRRSSILRCDFDYTAMSGMVGPWRLRQTLTLAQLSTEDAASASPTAKGHTPRPPVAGKLRCMRAASFAAK